MGFLKDLAIGAAGYAVASAKDSRVVGDIIDNNITTKPIEDIIQNYARRHQDYGIMEHNHNPLTNNKILGLSQYENTPHK